MSIALYFDIVAAVVWLVDVIGQSLNLFQRGLSSLQDLVAYIRLKHILSTSLITFKIQGVLWIGGHSVYALRPVSSLACSSQE